MTAKKPQIDTHALGELFSQASALQDDTLRKTIETMTLAALQSREMTVKSIKDALKAVTQATSAVAAGSGLPPADVEPLLAQVIEGMDSALVQAVEAQRRALQQLIERGAQLRDAQMKKAMEDIEKMEEVFFGTLTKVSDAAGGAQSLPWAKALDDLMHKGSGTGSSASAAVQTLTDSAHEAVRQGHAMGTKAAQAWMSQYAALANGVLIGMNATLPAQRKPSSPSDETAAFVPTSAPLAAPRTRSKR